MGDYDPQAGTVIVEPVPGGPVAAGSPAVAVPITCTSNSLTVQVPNSAIGDDGIVDAVTVAGNLATPTDCAPDGGVLTSDRGTPQLESVPAMSPIGLAVMDFVLLLTVLVVLRSS